MKKDGPWTSGPRELLEHAKDHLAKATDVDNRFAMISVDNAVELMLTTYLRLPRGVTGLILTRKERDEHTKDFRSALAAIKGLLGQRGHQARGGQNAGAGLHLRRRRSCHPAKDPRSGFSKLCAQELSLIHI